MHLNILSLSCNQKQVIMKFLLFTLLLSFGTKPTPPQPQAPAITECKCSYPLKQNTNWCQGPKGGNYCINRNGNKTYKPKQSK